MNCEHYMEPRHKRGNKQRAFCAKKKIYTDPAICRFCGQKQTKETNEEEKDMEESIFKIVRKLGTLSKNKSGWVKALTLTSWHGKPAKLDIRDWNEDYTKCGKGLTFTEDETRALKSILEKEDI